MSIKRCIAAAAATAIGLGALAACSKDDTPSSPASSHAISSHAPKDPNLSDEERIAAIIAAQETNSPTSFTGIGDKDAELTGTTHIEFTTGARVVEGDIDLTIQVDAEAKISRADVTVDLGTAAYDTTMYLNMVNDPAIVYVGTNDAWAQQAIAFDELEEKLATSTQIAQVNVGDYLKNMTDATITEKPDRYVITGTPDVGALNPPLADDGSQSDMRFATGVAQTTIEVRKDDYSLLAFSFSYDGTFTSDGVESPLKMTLKLTDNPNPDVNLEIPREAKASDIRDIFKSR